jgi:murein DD-endopeptidase MepM/ murein hydrolase activator NlpD
MYAPAVPPGTAPHVHDELTAPPAPIPPRDVPAVPAGHRGELSPVESDGTADEELLLPAGVVTSPYGWRRDPFHGVTRFHRGVDIRAAYGQEIPSAGSGRVVFSGAQGAYGTTVVVEHGDGIQTRYAHLSAALVSEGDEVRAGQVIGRAGRSGRATGTHLHFEVLANGRQIDPQLAGLKPEQAAAD